MENSESKSCRIFVRLSPEEKEQLQKCAIKSGYSLSSYIRNITLGRKIIPKYDVEMIFQIKKLGVNINQIARNLNTFLYDENVVNMVDYLEETKQKFDEIINILEQKK